MLNTRLGLSTAENRIFWRFSARFFKKRYGRPELHHEARCVRFAAATPIQGANGRQLLISPNGGDHTASLITAALLGSVATVVILIPGAHSPRLTASVRTGLANSVEHHPFSAAFMLLNELNCGRFGSPSGAFCVGATPVSTRYCRPSATGFGESAGAASPFAISAPAMASR